MLKVALFVRLQAKPGKETDVSNFLEQGLTLANQEAQTPVWFALRLGPSTFGVFDGDFAIGFLLELIAQRGGAGLNVVVWFGFGRLGVFAGFGRLL